MSFEIFVRDVDGEQALFVAPGLSDDDSTAVKEGLARRRLVAQGGRCPCGAVMRLPSRAVRRANRKLTKQGATVIQHVTVNHEDECPATEENLRAARRRGGR